MYYKLTENGIVLDLLTETKWIKYLPNLKCFVGTDKNSANSIMGSDNNTIYHIIGQPYNFSETLTSVSVEEISKKEYEDLSNQIKWQKTNNNSMKEEISSLRDQLAEQNFLLNTILKKLI